MSITFNAPSSVEPTIGQPKPTKSGPEKKLSPAEQSKQRQKENLQKQQQQIKKKLERLSDTIRHTATLVLAEDPNDDPNYLFQQCKPTLDKMGLKNIERNKTELIPGQTDNRKNSLYKILLRRDTEITPDIISRIKREEKSLNSIKWSSNGIEVYIWEKYVAQVTTGPVVPAK